MLSRFQRIAAWQRLGGTATGLTDAGLRALFLKDVAQEPGRENDSRWVRIKATIEARPIRTLQERDLNQAKNSKRRPYACHHEAAHCVARWYLGAWTEFAEVFDDDRRCLGVTLAGDEQAFFSEGRFVGKALLFETPKNLAMHADRSIIDSYRKLGEARAEMELLVVVAGCVAEARYRKSGSTTCWLMADLDREIARRIGARWLDDLPGAIDVAFARAGALMSSGAASRAIDDVARRLRRSGSVDGREIDMICEFTFGREQPSLYDWTNHWAPSLGLLKQGWLPPNHQSSDGIPTNEIKYEARA